MYEKHFPYCSRENVDFFASSKNLMVLPAGIEPATLGFEDRYSIQLS